MPESYEDKFNILDSFKSTELQEIFIATTKDESATGAVINMIKDPEHIKIIDTEILQKSLGNLIFLEEQEDRLILVTKVIEAEPMIIYLEENYIPIKGRMDLAFQYLSAIVAYDSLSDPIKASLIDEAQLVVMDGKLLIDELILLQEEPQQLTEADIARKVAEVLKKILFFEYQGVQQEEVLLGEVTLFLNGLEENPENMGLEEIFRTFRKLYIYHYCMEGIDPEIKLPQKKREIRPWPAIAVLTVIVLVLGAYGLLNLIPEEIEGTDPEPVISQPVIVPAFSIVEKPPYWEFINETPGIDENQFEEFLWEVIYQDKVIQSAATQNVTLSFTQGGIYTISLKVKGINQEWSEAHTQALEIPLAEGQGANTNQGTSDEVNSLYTLSIEGQNNILLDDGKLYSKVPSYRLINDQDLVPTFTLRNFEGRAFESLSMVLTSSQKEDVKISLSVYEKGKVIHQVSEDKVLEVKGDWETVLFSLPVESIIEEIKFQIQGFEQPIWVNQVALDPLK